MTEKKTAGGIFIQILKKRIDEYKTKLESKIVEYNTLKVQTDSTKEIFEKMINHESESIIDRIEWAADKDLVGEIWKIIIKKKQNIK